jgi:Arc/MetJ-type ribon-helix-helix transcriptional regulator
MAKKQYTVRLPKECEDWLEKKIRNRTYKDATHGIEVCIREQMKKEGLVKDE